MEWAIFAPVVVSWVLCWHATILRQLDLQLILVTAVTVKIVVMTMENQEVRLICTYVFENIAVCWWNFLCADRLSEWDWLSFVYKFFFFVVAFLPYILKEGLLLCDTALLYILCGSYWCSSWQSFRISGSHCYDILLHSVFIYLMKMFLFSESWFGISKRC